jgi:hypothetical protein
VGKLRPLVGIFFNHLDVGAASLRNTSKSTCTILFTVNDLMPVEFAPVSTWISTCSPILGKTVNFALMEWKSPDYLRISQSIIAAPLSSISGTSKFRESASSATTLRRYPPSGDVAVDHFLTYARRMAKIKVVVEITLAHPTAEPPDVKVTVEPEKLSPEQLDDATRGTPLRSTQSGTALDDKAR